MGVEYPQYIGGRKIQERAYFDCVNALESLLYPQGNYANPSAKDPDEFWDYYVLPILDRCLRELIPHMLMLQELHRAIYIDCMAFTRGYGIDTNDEKWYFTRYDEFINEIVNMMHDCYNATIDHNKSLLYDLDKKRGVYRLAISTCIMPHIWCLETANEEMAQSRISLEQRTY